MNRREFMRLAGGGIVLAATAGLVSGCAGFGVPRSAVVAWNDPPADTDIRRRVLSYALLAPNPHNMQPWMADLSRADEITVRLDPTRLLPETDPYGRQILMGCGAFLELLSMAAAEYGYACSIALFPEGDYAETLDGKAFARVRLNRQFDVAGEPLFAHVLRRRTDRREYDPMRLPTVADVERLQAAVDGMPLTLGIVGMEGANDAERVQSIRDIATEAWRIELTTERTMMESMRVLRWGSDEIDTHRDGLNITSPMLVTMKRIGIIDANAFPAPDSTATTSQLKQFHAITSSTPGYLWIRTQGNRRDQQIAAGRAYARVALAAVGLRLGLHPNQQALQEYPEMAKPYRAIHRLLDATAPTCTVQMLARIGYLPPGSEDLGPAPRRGLAALIAG